MRKLLWLAAWSGVALWSLFALAAYGLVDWIGGLMARNADLFSSDPEIVEWISRVFNLIHSASTSLALIVWGGVSLLILGVPWLLDRMAGKAQLRVFQGTIPPGFGTAQPPRWNPGGSPGAPREGVIDLSPDQYSVRSRPGRPGASGSVPQVGPRG